MNGNRNYDIYKKAYFQDVGYIMYIIDIMDGYID